MLHRLYAKIAEAGVVAGIEHPSGWGASVKHNVIPYLDHPKLFEHRQIIEEGLGRAREPISVFVVGEGKFGKSTLINAMLGEEIAAVHFLPKTFHITRYIYRAERDPLQLKIVYDHSSESSIRFEKDLRVYCRTLDSKAGVAIFDTDEKLNDFLREEEAHESHTGDSDRSPILEVIRSLPFGVSTNSHDRPFSIVDTPGLSQLRTRSAKGDSIEDFYHGADVVVWLLSSDKIKSRDSKAHLISMSRYGKPIVIVINKADMIPKGQKHKVVDQVRREYEGIKGLQEIKLLSAKQGWRGKIENDHELLVSSGLIDLERIVRRLAGSKADLTKGYSLYNTCKQAAQECSFILEQEAERLAENLVVFDQNLKIAESYKSLASMSIKNKTKSTLPELRITAEKKMRETANFSSMDKQVPVFSKNQTEMAVIEMSRIILGRATRELEQELNKIQDRIALNKYKDPVYGRNACIKAHNSKTSLNLRISRFSEVVCLENFHPIFSFSDLFDSFLGMIGDVAAYFGFGETRTAEEKNRDKRKKLLDRYIQGLDSVLMPCNHEIEESLFAGAEETTHSLVSEVDRCFMASFESRENISTLIGKHQTAARACGLPSLQDVTIKILGATAIRYKLN